MAELAGNEEYLTEQDIRVYLRDRDPEGNLLLDDLEFSPEEIRTASTIAVDYFNETPPLIARFTVGSFSSRYHLLIGTCAQLFYMAAHRYRRNKLTHRIPGGGVSDQDKDADYDRAGDRLWQQYTQWVARYKRAVNIEHGWGAM